MNAEHLKDKLHTISLMYYKCEERFPSQQAQTWKKLSTTIWAYQLSACRVLLAKAQAIIDTPAEITVEHSSKRSTHAIGLLKSVDFVSILNLLVFTDFHYRTKFYQICYSHQL